MRKPIVVGNWKMNLNHREATYCVQKLAWLLRDAHFDYATCDVAVLPPFTSIRSVQVLADADNLKISYGAQAVAATSQGAFTGDVSADMLAALDCSYVIVGHSERRKYHPEDDATLVDETRAILTAGMHPILCVGESYDERKQGIELEYAVGQVNDVTRDLSDDEVSRMLIAYEPVWAIGTGMVADGQTAQDAAHAIREHLVSAFSTQVAERVRILYGGSVNSKNASQLMMQAKDMDGFLVGGASLDPDEFSAIARLVQKAAQQR